MIRGIVLIFLNVKKTVPLPIDKYKSSFKKYYLFFKVITPARNALVLLCFHPDTVRQLTPL